jgi:hypothetical protein
MERTDALTLAGELRELAEALWHVHAICPRLRVLERAAVTTELLADRVASLSAEPERVPA